MIKSLRLLLTLGLASADQAVVRSSETETARQLIVGAPGQVLTYEFNGTGFANVGNISEPGRAASWMALNAATNVLYAVDENSNATRAFTYDPTTNEVSAEPFSLVNGSSGVVYLEFDQSRTHMLGASYSEGQVDVWDLSAADGSLDLVKQLVLEGPVGPNQASQGVHRAHQALLDPSGQFFAINDLGGDAIHFVSASTFEITNRVQVEPAGAGPRHGAFIIDPASNPDGSSTATPTHYVVACELMNLIILYELSVDATSGSVLLTNPQTLSTYGPGSPPANASTAAAGELILASNQRDIYVSNRNSGNATDSVAHFVFSEGAIAFVDQAPSGGISPRMMSFSADETLVFVANQEGADGIVVLERCADSGELSTTPLAVLPNADINTQTGGWGPEFVLEVAATST
ncbi:Lactonase, 7-bladed beta-propeller-domain-containing protein [Xylariales sp. PMI_506]|nr:Lactonase, 7-bladed beta-propeller-domain-containing protein [Xylariales sp. PMI_506]